MLHLALPDGLANANPVQWACAIALVLGGIAFVMANRRDKGPK